MDSIFKKAMENTERITGTTIFRRNFSRKSKSVSNVTYISDYSVLCTLI